MAYRRRRTTILSGGRRRTTVRRTRSAKTGSRPGFGWFSWAWGSVTRRGRRHRKS